MTTLPFIERTTRPGLRRRLVAALLNGLAELRRAQLARLRSEALRRAALRGSPGHDAAVRVLREIYGDRLPSSGSS